MCTLLIESFWPLDGPGKLLNCYRDVAGDVVSLPEWSKGLRSGRNVFERVGSNPTADISFYW